MIITKEDIGKHYFLRDSTISKTAEIMRIYNTGSGYMKVVIKLSRDGTITERHTDGRLYTDCDSPWDLVREDIPRYGDYSWW